MREKTSSRFNDKLIYARVLKDGQVSYSRKRYTFPSLAAAAACKRRVCNGWTFWTYEQALRESRTRKISWRRLRRSKTAMLRL